MNWDSIASIATAIGVFVAAWQLWENRKLTGAAFEDSFDQQYRELSYLIPVNALLGKSLDDVKKDQARESVYNYLDLCNEQIYQRTKGRISEERWRAWASGIDSNLSRPFFMEVWDEVKENAPSTFSFLERLEKNGFSTDPAKWKNA